MALQTSHAHILELHDPFHCVLEFLFCVPVFLYVYVRFFSLSVIYNYSNIIVPCKKNDVAYILNAL